MQKILVSKTYMQPDFYSKEEGIIGEIFAHIGKPKKGQDKKLQMISLKCFFLKNQRKEYIEKLLLCVMNRK